MSHSTKLFALIKNQLFQAVRDLEASGRQFSRSGGIEPAFFCPKGLLVKSSEARCHWNLQYQNFKKGYMMQWGTRQKFHQFSQQEGGLVSTEVKQGFDLPKLYNFLQLVKYGPGKQSHSSARFEGRSLLDVGRAIARTLNQPQSSYHKYYVGALCVFVCIITIPHYSRLVGLLKKPFFQSLAPILADILQYWRNSQESDKSEAARAKMLAYLKSIYEVTRKNPSFHSRAYNCNVLQILSNFEVPNDESIIKIYCKVVFQASREGTIFNKKFGHILYRVMKHPNFPVSTLNGCISYIQASLDPRSLSGPESAQVVANLKKILRQNFDVNETQAINWNRLVLFMSMIQSSGSYPLWELSELRSLCEMMHSDLGKDEEKIRCIKSIASIVISFEESQKKEDVSGILEFIDDCSCGLEVMAAIIVKLSSSRFFNVVMGGLLEKVIQSVANRALAQAIRWQALKLLAYLVSRMSFLNMNLHWQIRQTFECLKLFLKEQQKWPSSLIDSVQIVSFNLQLSLQ